MEQYGYEEFQATCEGPEELAEARLMVETLLAERYGATVADGGNYTGDDVPFDDAPHPADDGTESFNKLRQRRQQSNNRPAAVKCGICGGPTWDNREGKRTGKTSDRAPDFKCKDKDECGAAMWLTKDGEHGEWKQ